MVELELGPLAAAFSRNGGTYDRITERWPGGFGGVGRSTDTSERVDGLMRSDQPGSAALGRIVGRERLPLRAGGRRRGVGFRREGGRGPSRLFTVWRSKIVVVK